MTATAATVRRGRHTRERYTAPSGVGPPSVTDYAGGDVRVPYAELHCHSNFSFLDGASHPEELVEAAALLGLDAIAITDHDGMYGVVRFAEAAKELGVRTVFGTELSLGLSQPQNGIADPEGDHLLLLATGPDGYGRLCRAITDGQLAHDSEKGRPVYDFDDVVDQTRGEVVALTGCRKASVRRALLRDGPDAAFAELHRLADAFGRDHTFVELIDHGLPLDTTHNDLLAEMALELRLPMVATNAVHYAQPTRGELAAAMAAVRARRSLDEMDGWLPPAPTAYLRSGEEMHAPVRALPGRGAAVRAARRAAVVRPEAGRAAAAAVRGAGPHRDQLPAGEDVRGRAGPLRPAATSAEGVRAARPRAEGHRGARLPRLLPDRRRHRGLLPRQGHLLPGPGVGRELGGLLRAGHHQGRRGALATCCSNGSSRRRGTARRTSTWTSSRTAARRPSSTSTRSTTGGTPRRSRTSSRTGRSRRCGTWRRRSATRRASRTRGANRSTAGRR